MVQREFPMTDLPTARRSLLDAVHEIVMRRKQVIDMGAEIIVLKFKLKLMEDKYGSA